MGVTASSWTAKTLPRVLKTQGVAALITVGADHGAALRLGIARQRQLFGGAVRLLRRQHSWRAEADTHHGRDLQQVPCDS